MNRSKLRITLAALVGVTLATIGLFLAQQAKIDTTNEQLPITVTEVMMDQWCAMEYGDAFRASNVSGSDPFQWRCWGRSNGIVTENPIPMDQLCSSTGPRDLLPRVVPGPTGWECSLEP